jgi:hypothetical protein
VPFEKGLGGVDVTELQRLWPIDENEPAAEKEGARLVHDDTSHGLNVQIGGTEVIRPRWV